MCGIVGYIGENPSKEFIIDGLKKLEYRGYDSAGIMLYTDKAYLKKAKGKIYNLENKLSRNNYGNHYWRIELMLLLQTMPLIHLMKRVIIT